jgi:hypothetical protein
MQEINSKKVIEVPSIKKIICEVLKMLRSHAFKQWENMASFVKFFKALKTIYTYDTNQNMDYRISGFHNRDYEECRLLWCGAVWVYYKPTFQRNVC